MHATPVDVWIQQYPQKIALWCGSPIARDFPSSHRTRHFALRPGLLHITAVNDLPSRFLVRTSGPSRFPQSRPCDVTLVCTLPLLALRPNSISCSQEDSQTSCFRRLFRSHGPTLTLSVPEPLCRVVLLSSAKTLRRNCGLHATPVGLRIQQHPPIPGMLGDRLLQASFPLSRADLDPRGS